MRIAVFIAGPYRYVDLVVQRLDSVLDGLSVSYFFHLWRSENSTGEKDRGTKLGNLRQLTKNPRTKALTVIDPYTEAFYAARIGRHTVSNSPIHATMGMFLSQMTLLNVLSSLPDSATYQWILRVRTDCLLTTGALRTLIVEGRKRNLFALNPHTANSWVSDHTCFCRKRVYERVWRFKSANNLYLWYRICGRNPERLLTYRIMLKVPFALIAVSIRRYVDYHIIYSSAKSTDPDWIKSLGPQANIPKLFAEVDRLFDQRSAMRAFGQTEYDSRERPALLYFLKKRIDKLMGR